MLIKKAYDQVRHSFVLGISIARPARWFPRCNFQRLHAAKPFWAWHRADTCHWTRKGQALACKTKGAPAM